MRVCVVSLFGQRKITVGSQTHCWWLIKFLTEKKIPCVYITPYTFNPPVAYIFLILSYFSGRVFRFLDDPCFFTLRYFFIKKGLRKILNNNRGINIINAQDPLSALAALEVKRVLRLKAKIALTIHMNFPSLAEEEVYAGKLRKGSRFYFWLTKRERISFLGVDRIIFPSNYIAKEVLKKYPEVKGKSRIIYYGIGDPPLNSRHPSHALGKRIILNIGTLCARKNQQFLLKVTQRLSKKNGLIELHLIGEGKDKAFLENFARSLGIENLVQFRGIVRNAWQGLKEAWLYVHSSLVDNAPFAIIEAIAFGVPVVALSVGGIPEMVKHGYNGYLVEGEDVDTFAGYIEELLDNEAKYISMSQNCRNIFKERFDYRIMGREFLLSMQKDF